jgi:phage terminase large subunit-like protein
VTTAVAPPKPSKINELDLKAAIARDGDLASYAKVMHNYDCEPYQPVWGLALETRNRTAIVCPPDTFKTTTVRMFVEREIGKNPEISILWLMNSGSQSTKNVMTVSAVIKGNQVYKRAFNIEEDTEAQWTKEVLFVKRNKVSPDPTLMATGFNGPYQGLHFDLIILDDLTNQEDVRSPTTMELQRSKLRGVIIDRLLPNGRIVALFTRWGPEDLMDTYLDMGFTVIMMPVVGDYPWGPTLSPTKFPLERIEGIRKDKGPLLFDLTFMCNAQAVTGSLIPRDIIAYWDKESLPEHRLVYFMGVDLAASTKTWADYSAFATVGLDIKTHKKYLVELWAGKMELPELKEFLYKRAKGVANLVGFGLETEGFQLGMLQDMRRKYRLPFVEIPYRTRRQTQLKCMAVDRSKVGRAMYLGAKFFSGELFIPKSLPLLDGYSFESELCGMPHPPNKHDDRVDALAMATIMADGMTPKRRRLSLKVW